MQNQTAARQVNLSTRKGALKTILWLCIFLGLGWLISGPLFKGKPAPETRKTKNDSWLVGENDARVKELGAKYNAINFNDLSDYYYHSPDPWETPDPQLVKKSKIPDAIKALNGKAIAITGFMMPLNANLEGTTEFVLNGNYDMCGFGGPVMVNEWAMVKFVGKGKVPYTHLPMTVFGTLEVGEEHKEGRLYSLYRIKADAVSTPKGVVE
jgi:hypothetical protein